ncbi:MAG TPA: ATP-binding protein [Myxococcaceae bacterium]|jgi:PAS domain S-box-containing protein
MDRKPEAQRPASERLKAHKERVIALCMERIRQAIPARAREEPRLRHHLLQLLDGLVAALASASHRPITEEVLNSLPEDAGYPCSHLEDSSLHHMFREYQLLREVIFQVLEQEGPLTLMERDLLLAALEQAVAEASARFMRLAQSRTRAAKEHLGSAHQELQEVFMRAPTPMMVLSGREHRFALVNPPFESMVRRSVLGKAFQEAFSEEEAAHILPLIHKVYETGAPHVWPELPMTFTDEKGLPRRLYFNVSCTPLKDPQEAVRAVTCLMVDVTEQVETRRGIEESEARFRQIANALPQIIWTATADFFVDWYNDWWFKYLGLPRGTRWDDADTQPMHPEDVEQTRPRLREAVETGNDFLMEQRFRRGTDGQYRWHLVRGVPIRDSEGRILKWIGANTDIHDQKTFTARLEEERDLRERFVATLTHDLRTPLTAAKLNAHMVARKAGDPTALYKLAARISENLDRADQMIRDLLDANRISAGEGLPVDVSECELTALTRETLEELSLVHGDRFVLNAPAEIHGYWSCSGMRRILENLCSNAIKYGARDQAVTVSLAENGPDEVVLSVHNWGPPISPEDQKLLFQQYRRIDSAGSRTQKGWGLGLTLVEGLAKAHRGAVRVESTQATGTTFTITVARDLRS